MKHFLSHHQLSEDTLSKLGYSRSEYTGIPIGELALNAWLLFEVSHKKNSFRSCRVTVADHIEMGMYYFCPTVLNVFHGSIDVKNPICSQSMLFACLMCYRVAVCLFYASTKLSYQNFLNAMFAFLSKSLFP